mmetsp:Transcript_16302/g.42251  ORF Transcript_16302/g.42251 Transcript_16302/m.42251 type:complete len:246 (+) Transcript_16302:1065-1802(+)
MNELTEPPMQDDPLRARPILISLELARRVQVDRVVDYGTRAAEAAVRRRRDVEHLAAHAHEAVPAALHDGVALGELERAFDQLSAALVHLHHRVGRFLERAEPRDDLLVRAKRQVGVREVDQEVKVERHLDHGLDGVEQHTHHRERAPLHQPAAAHHVHVLQLLHVVCDRGVCRAIQFEVEVEEEEVRRVVERVDEARDHQVRVRAREHDEVHDPRVVLRRAVRDAHAHEWVTVQTWAQAKALLV